MVNITLCPGHTVVDAGIVIVGFGVTATTTMEVAEPHAVEAVAITEPAVAPKFTVMALELVGADVMLAPGGTCHEYVAPPTLLTEYVTPV
jgi:hypothetical protein